MKNKLYIFFSVIIIVLGLFLRLWKMENRTPFDWDQNRDYQVITQITKGKFTLIGPVAKGEGGFFLGPLYYYLATPSYLIMHGDPRALPYTSVIIDILTLAAILILLRKLLGDAMSLSLGSIWAVSWFTIELSRISWNVSLVPLWSIFILWFFARSGKLTNLAVFGLGLVLGMSWHIHAALIPLAFALAIIYGKKWYTRPRDIIYLGCGYLISLVPLILFDLRHAGLNYHLLTQMFLGTGKGSYPFFDLLGATLMRLGKNTEGLLTGSNQYNLYLGVILSILSFFGIAKGDRLLRLSSLIIILNILAVLALKDPGFPEYYFALCYLPSLIVIYLSLSKLVRGNILVLSSLVVISAILNLRHYSVEETSFSLSRKIAVVQAIGAESREVDLQFDVAPGREGGIAGLYTLSGGKISRNSRTKIMVTDHQNQAIYIGGELSPLIGNYGGFSVAKNVVQ